MQDLQPALSCPLCGSSATRLAFVHQAYPIRDCRGCGHRFAGFTPKASHVEEVYGDDYFHGGGAGYPDYTAEAELLTAAGERYGKLLNRYTDLAPLSPGGRGVGGEGDRRKLLDIGAAAGFLLQGYARAGWHGIGIEPNRSMAEYAKRELGRTVHAGTLESVPLPQPFDAVSWVQVLAHLPAPMESFRIADSLTRPGGLWLIETWNAASRTARLLGQAWHEYSPPSVLHWWTPAVLKRTLSQFGYKLRGTGFAQKWIGFGHARSLVEHKYGHGLPTKIAKLFPESWKAPYPSEDLFWAVYGKAG
jgi:SAM-dependent methyltransferase